MILSNAFMEYAKRETDLVRLGTVVRLVAGGDVPEANQTARVLAETFLADGAAKEANIERRREAEAERKRKRREMSEMPHGQTECPTDKADVQNVPGTNAPSVGQNGQTECPTDKADVPRTKPPSQNFRSTQPSNQPSIQPTNQYIPSVNRRNARGGARPPARETAAPPKPPKPSGPPDEISSGFPSGGDSGEASESDGYFDPTGYRVDYGTIFSDADPVLLAMSLTHDTRDADRRTFGALLKSVGDKAFRNTLATLYGEMNAGEVPTNPPGALIAKLRDAERIMNGNV